MMVPVVVSDVRGPPNEVKIHKRHALLITSKARRPRGSSERNEICYRLGNCDIISRNVTRII